MHNNKLFLAVESVGLVHSLGIQESFLRAWEQHPLPTYRAPAAPPDCSELATLFPKNALRRLPHYAKMGLLAAHKALSTTQTERETTALVVASAHTCVRMSFDFMDSILDFGPHLSSPTAFSHAVNNMGAGLISLLLGIRGSCTTVTQFELSFAGAVQVAATLLYSRRVSRVLLGAVEELDPRWNPLFAQSNTANPQPEAEGAIFFVLRRKEDMGQAAPYSFSVPDWSTHFPHEYTKHCQALYVSGQARSPETSGNVPPQKLSGFYGESPLAHALDCFLMGQHLSSTEQAQGLCVCADSATQRHAAITVRSSICMNGR